jgi:hypothetical protein
MASSAEKFHFQKIQNRPRPIRRFRIEAIRRKTPSRRKNAATPPYQTEFQADPLPVWQLVARTIHIVRVAEDCDLSAKRHKQETLAEKRVPCATTTFSPCCSI